MSDLRSTNETAVRVSERGFGYLTVFDVPADVFDAFPGSPVERADGGRSKQVPIVTCRDGRAVFVSLLETTVPSCTCGGRGICTVCVLNDLEKERA